MTNKELFKAWEEYRKEMFHCVPDEEGNYPCDNGAMCDRCCTDEAVCGFTSWKRAKEQKQPKRYIITVSDKATYSFPANEYTLEEAKQQAWEWFDERKPSFEIGGI